MLLRILSLYLESLLLATLGVGLWGAFSLGIGKISRKKKTLQEKRARLYETLLIAVMIVPILAFAVMGLLLMVKA